MSADDLVRAYVLDKYREEYPAGHIAGCDSAEVVSFDSRDGTYGCETGCEYLTLEAVIGCPHEEPVEYEYGEFGDISGLIFDLEKYGKEGPWWRRLRQALSSPRRLRYLLLRVPPSSW